jgi:RecJ-like exonuclease
LIEPQNVLNKITEYLDNKVELNHLTVSNYSKKLEQLPDFEAPRKTNDIVNKIVQNKEENVTRNDVINISKQRFSAN